ncbi:hypothetical protein DP939_07300 [Spongiactinospora rosea]|uniref:DUF1440 domain-containing protein n=2 Tax=Spongiactinospora rosea TaxID=2248750 RepID=A0A366M3U0_9ACTN|nr:hypothetical protein DP939_07300 [Spongiactinospora rosea]
MAAKGALGGLLATGAMSVLMLAGSRAGLMEDQPPKRIARAAMAGDRHSPKRGERVVGMFAHAGFGAASGAVYAVCCRGRPTPALPALAYALGIWFVSYEGWVPKLGILPPISGDRPGRPAVMAVGHIVYGLVLARFLNRLNRAQGGSG